MTIRALIIVPLLVIGRGECALAADQDDVATKASEMRILMNDFAETIWELAAQRQHANERMGIHWIVGLQKSSFEVMKITDGKWTLVLFPFQSENEGFLRFAEVYDQRVLASADQKARAGDLDFAENAYRLLLKFAPATFSRADLTRRLQLLTKLRDNPDPSAKAAALSSLQPTESLLSFLGRLDEPPKTVPSLSKLELTNWRLTGQEEGGGEK